MIHVITGPPCGGKSTYLSKHAKPGDLKIDYDEIALTMGAKVKWYATGLVMKAALKAREAAIETALINQDEESWIIHSRPSADALKAYEDAGAEIVEIDPGKDTCLERAKRDERPENIISAINTWYAGRKGTEMRFKDCAVQYKDEGTGSIEGYASTWIRKADSYGDVVKQGAFAKSLKERWSGGKGIPFIWAHQVDRLDSFIGTATADEDEKGLHFIATFDNTPEAQKVRQLYKDGRLRKFSFAYAVLDYSNVKLEDGTNANELREVDLYEISAVTVPANDDAGVVDVKSGRRNSKSDADKLEQAITLNQQAVSLIQDVLKEPDTGDVNSGEDNLKGNAAAEARKESNPEKDKLLEYINTL